MSSFYKLKALVKKNFLEMRRNIFSTIFEIFLPIILISLFWLLKTAYEIDEIEFEKDEINLSNFIKKHSIVNSNTDSDLWEDLYTKETKILDICRSGRYKHLPAGSHRRSDESVSPPVRSSIRKALATEARFPALRCAAARYSDPA